MNKPAKLKLPRGILAFFVLTTATWAQIYYQDFDIGSHDLKSLDYRGNNWCTDSTDGNWYMKSPCGRKGRNEHGALWGAGFVQSSRFDVPFSNKSNNGFTMQYGVLFPEACQVTECREEEDSRIEYGEIEAQCMGHMDGELKYMRQMSDRCKGKGKEVEKHKKYWRKWLMSEKLWAGLSDAKTGRPLYTVLFMPNRAENVDEINVVLQNLNGMSTVTGSTKTLTPRGGKDASIAFKIAVFDDTIKIFYGEKGAFQESPVISTYIGKQKIDVGRIFFVYQKGKCKQGEVWVDNIQLTNNNVVAHRTDSEHTFSKALYASNGNNVSDTFEIKDLRQSAYQLATDIGGETGLPGWFEYANTIQQIASATDNINGIPLIIAYAKYYSLTQDNQPEQKTFFMAATNKDTTHSRKVNFIFPYGCEYTTHEDAIRNVSLEIDGNTVLIDSVTSIGAYQFTSAGEKTIKARVQFESGFVGNNLFRLVVKPMNDGTWYNDN